MADIRGGHLPLALMSASGRKAKFRCDRRMSALVEQPAPLHNTVIVICSSAPSTGRAVLVVVLSAQQLPGRLEELT